MSTSESQTELPTEGLNPSKGLETSHQGPKSGVFYFVFSVLLCCVFAFALFYQDIAAEVVYRCYLLPVCQDRPKREFYLRMRPLSGLGVIGSKTFAKLAVARDKNYSFRSIAMGSIFSSDLDQRGHEEVQVAIQALNTLADRLQRGYNADDFNLLFAFGVCRSYEGLAKSVHDSGIGHRGCQSHSPLRPIPVIFSKGKLWSRFPVRRHKKVSLALCNLVSERKASQRWGRGSYGRSGGYNFSNELKVSKEQRIRWLKIMFQYPQRLEHEEFDGLTRVVIEHKDIEPQDFLLLMKNRFEQGLLSSDRILHAIIEVSRGDAEKIKSLPYFEETLVSAARRGFGESPLFSINELAKTRITLEHETCDAFRPYIEKQNVLAKLNLGLIVYRSTKSTEDLLLAVRGCQAFSRSELNGTHRPPISYDDDLHCSLYCFEHSAVTELFNEVDMSQRRRLCGQLQELFHKRRRLTKNEAGETTEKETDISLDWALLRRCYLLATVRDFEAIDSSDLSLITREIRFANANMTKQDFDDLLMAIFYCGPHMKSLEPELRALAEKLAQDSKRQILMVLLNHLVKMQ